MPRTVLALLALANIIPFASAQSLAPLLQQLRSNRPEQRIEAFYGIVSLGTPSGANPVLSVGSAIPALARNSAELRTGLIEALKSENAYLGRGVEPGEDYSSYFGDLLHAVTSLRDPRSIPALVDAMGTGNLVMDALAAFGQPAADQVLGKLNRGVSKRSACVLLGRMLDSRNPNSIQDAASRKQIEDSLLKASQSFGPLVKLSALEALTKSNNPELRKSAVNGLLELAKGREGTVPAAAFYSLQYMANSTSGGSSSPEELAVNALGALARDPENTHQRAATEALNSLAKSGSSENRKRAEAVLSQLPIGGRLGRWLPGFLQDRSNQNPSRAQQ